MEKAAGRNLLPGAVFVMALLLLAGTFAAAPLMPFVIRVGLNCLGLLSLAVAVFLTIREALQAPTHSPRLRAGAVVILGLGVVAIVIMTPFAALALAAAAGPSGP